MSSLFPTPPNRLPYHTVIVSELANPLHRLSEAWIVAMLPTGERSTAAKTQNYLINYRIIGTTGRILHCNNQGFPTINLGKDYESMQRTQSLYNEYRNQINPFGKRSYWWTFAQSLASRERKGCTALFYRIRRIEGGDNPVNN